MKLSEAWLREWVNPALSLQDLCHQLTMAGLEVDEIAPVADAFSQVIIGRIETIEKHPEADRLNVCQVNVGGNELLQIVCGASNARANLLVAVAMVGAVLPGDKKITAATLRGVASAGMLCSAKELGLPEENDGLIELSSDAPIGTDLREYFQLNDFAIDISITPNRGDCLSVKGVARDVSAMTKTALIPHTIAAVPASINDVIEVNVSESAACPRYLGRVIKGVKANTPSPIWLRERLRRSGIRTISIVVDVTNYVMLELGQPMHAFDLKTLDKGIHVRLSKANEKIKLLDDSEQTLDDKTLVIADAVKPLAIAGVMGGVDSSVTQSTTDILLESAFFSAHVIARQRQHYLLNSDSSYRFERGVDYNLQRDAIERATQLILEIAGGSAGPVIERVSEKDLPQANEVTLTKEKLDNVLGVAIDANDVTDILTRLQFQIKRNTAANIKISQQQPDASWTITSPSFRFDIEHTEDLIEEVARLFGYDNIPVHTPKAELQATLGKSTDIDLSLLKNAFKNHGYHEIVSYSFVDKVRQQQLDPDKTPVELVNPISAEMAVMRTNLWPGLVETFLYNQSRQQNDVRLVETGTCFIVGENGLQQITRLGGLLSGNAQPEQWGAASRKADFYDVKGDLENILRAYTGREFLFKVGQHPALHPGQTAAVFDTEKQIGIVGALHPALVQSLGLTGSVFLFEIDLVSLNKLGKSLIQDVSKFPEIRRDLAILVDHAVPADKIQDTIKASAGDWLKDVFVFDVYQGKGISPGLKSIALALTLQHPTRTLVDEEVAAVVEQITNALKGKLGAELRS